MKFPVNEDGKSDLEKLLAACEPASFGYKGKDVLDESYRKATKLDESAFSVSLCPYKLGIIDTIAQMLLPNAGGGIRTKGVKAELYKLNVYAAPSGFFKSHVDTPRSKTQFGSLVVSLPCYHEGGQLHVRHAGHFTKFDWGTASQVNTKPSVHWAAFYSDCEHEVREVTKGHRVTLTYNLYYALGSGDLAGNSPEMDATSLPLYRKIKFTLSVLTFMPEGGYLGVHCNHAYAHSTDEGVMSLPSVLKGSDMAVYSVFRALGLKIYMRAALEYDREQFYDSDEPDLLRELEGGVTVTDCGDDENEDYLSVLEEWNGYWTDVHWLNDPIDANLNTGMVHLTYGNQSGVGWIYTSAALIVEVPAASERYEAMSALE
ncbi:hypothetical protein DM02DRAFT_628995 [Periconia macrospinosa]|uniref:Fe2OG dioxygenase domain-containing protein n=1 Tax=Periconia macrospinosa TaxID=97972 RepID=A0A2V1DPI7_9PLEO|nr:hypothetical protein DM02DRAFT_628995 [Periconia macrospinosa]